MNRLKFLREEKGLFQKDIADYLNCSIAIISMYEKEQRIMDVIVAQKIADYFGVSTDFLLGKSDIRNIEELKKVPFANAGGINVDGLDEEDLLELQRQVDYIKDMKKKLKGDK